MKPFNAHTIWSAQGFLPLILVFCIDLVCAKDFREPPPDFRLTRWDSGSTVSLDDFSGQIVILDFFAYWCPNCRQASAEVQSGIGTYFTRRNGNAQGLPVTVIGVNIEQANRESTAAFIRRAGLKLVLDDPQGGFLQRLGGEGIPFIAVLSQGKLSGSKTEWSVVYKNAGNPGLDILRRVVNSIDRSIINDVRSEATGLSPAASAEAAMPAEESTDGELFAVRAVPRTDSSTRTWDFAAEMLRASDIALWDVATSYKQAHRHFDWNLSLSCSSISVEYQPAPIDFLGEASELDETRTALQAGVRTQGAKTLHWIASGGLYNGFSDFRSLWIGEFYRQRFSDLPGYKEPQPRGYNVSGGLRWEYLAGSGFLQAEMIYQRDEIAPSYDKPLFEPLRQGRQTFHTTAARLTLENALTSRLRALHSLQLTDTTARDLRFSYQALLNLALAEHWAVRSGFSFSEEAPRFHSWSAELTLERDWKTRWFLSAFGRYYRDNGRFEPTLSESLAAPSLQTIQCGLGVRWQGDRHSLKVVAGPYLTRYAALDRSVNEFANLYRSRDWLFAQIAFAHHF